MNTGTNKRLDPWGEGLISLMILFCWTFVHEFSFGGQKQDTVSVTQTQNGNGGTSFL